MALNTYRIYNLQVNIYMLYAYIRRTTRNGLLATRWLQHMTNSHRTQICSCEWMNIFVNWKLDEWKIFDAKTKEPISSAPAESMSPWKMSANKCAYNMPDKQLYVCIYIYMNIYMFRAGHRPTQCILECRNKYARVSNSRLNDWQISYFVSAQRTSNRFSAFPQVVFFKRSD